MSLSPKTDAEAGFARAFASAKAEEPARAAFAAFERRGLPSRRDEAWHYTDLRARLKAAAPLARKPDAARLRDAATRLSLSARLGAVRFVMVDGHYAPDLSDAAPKGVTAEAAELPAPAGADAVVSLNAAFAREALRIVVEPGMTPVSLEIVHIDGPGGVFGRVDLDVPAKSEVTLFERFDGATAQTQRNVVATLSLAEGARCDWTTLVADDAGAHLEFPVVRLAEGAALANFALVCGGALVRRQIEVGHDAPSAKIALAGLSLIDGERHADTTLTVRHGAPRGESREFYRHIVADRGVGVYQGKVIVAPHAQKTDGGMKSQALLLSPTAQMNNKPELEIFADDVVCGHGATVGALDPEQVFYLRARGLPKAEAEAMLLEAFGIEAIERVADPDIAEALRERLRDWLKGRAA